MHVFEPQNVLTQACTGTFSSRSGYPYQNLSLYVGGTWNNESDGFEAMLPWLLLRVVGGAVQFGARLVVATEYGESVP